MKHLIAAIIGLTIAGHATFAHAQDACLEQAKTEAAALQPTYELAVYVRPDGSHEELRRGACAAGSQRAYYSPKATMGTLLGALPAAVALPPGARPKPHVLPRAAGCPKLYVAAVPVSCGAPPPAPPPAPPIAPGARITGPDDVRARYLSVEVLKGDASATDPFRAASASSVAAEAVQILGQIVVDRASQAAYELVASKARAWLGCGKTTTRFPQTCRAITDLRLQDLAMAPSVLRAALTADAIAFVADKAAPAWPYIERTITSVVLPALRRPGDPTTPRTAEAMIRALVKEGMDALGRVGEVPTPYCQLAGKDRVLALAASAFVTCELTTSGKACPILQHVQRFDAACPVTPIAPLTADQLAHAAVIAGHLYDAVTLTRDGVTDDTRGRVSAAVDASIAVACMYADTDGGAYECALDPAAAAATPLTAAERVAVVRDLLHAALDRDGQALVATIAQVLIRVNPVPKDGEAASDQRKGLRVLATVAAYAATYTDEDSDPTAAHARRTKLLESLTRDMTDRTGRAGDTIFSLGGSLRAVYGRRFGAKVGDDRLDATYGPLSLTLGFGLDCLFEERRGGIHVEVGVLDLGQYLSWEDGGAVATPGVADSVAPSLTVGAFFGRELPTYIGVTAGVSPSFDFKPDQTTDELGGWQIGATVGVYVPLVDLN